MLVKYWLGKEESKHQSNQNRQFTELAKNPAFLSSYKMKDNPKYTILYRALTLFEKHMQEVKKKSQIK